MQPECAKGIELTHRQFQRISQLLYSRSGIVMPPGKELLVKNRLSARLKELRLFTFKDYLAIVEQDHDEHELMIMVELLTTNETSFFRERQHFDFMEKHIIPEWIAQSKTIRVWSAGCSSGEEPYSIAISLTEHIDGIELFNARILATDISGRMVDKGSVGIYSKKNVRSVSSYYLHKYFKIIREPNNDIKYQISDRVKKLVRYARHNLLQPWPMTGRFSLIFCRNVMIYFDSATQERLINRFWQILEPGGYLFVGHSESLSYHNHRFRYVQPAIYRKEV